ncbi:hypothetical protein ACFV1W_22930 [Kitasatospora sp. NPDC059648]|uniref:hypothetical protein n=1 Tax=Kitasatospora sp. NPDC059648 TaxID=3346894 RepID=UPI003679213C
MTRQSGEGGGQAGSGDDDRLDLIRAMERAHLSAADAKTTLEVFDALRTLGSRTADQVARLVAEAEASEEAE